jgi:hypothetical protein
MRGGGEMKGKRRDEPLSKPWLLLEDDPNPYFLNVDLHVESRKDLTPLAAALEDSILWQEWTDSGHWLHGSLAKGPDSPSAGILTLATLVKRLRGPAKTAWNAAKVREFDVGIEAGTENRRGEWIVSADAVESTARVGARIRITVYPPEQTAMPKPSKGTRRAR